LQAAQGPEVQDQHEAGRNDRRRFGHDREAKQEERQDVATRPRLPNIAHVGHQGEQQEQRADEVLAFGNPGHRIHLQGMPGKERCHDGAPPEGTSHLPQQ
jgi:hypothetical protein